MTITANTSQQTAAKRCRFCGAVLERTFIDLGMSPLCETYPSATEFNHGETYYPLHVYVCEECLLVQLEEYERPEDIFGDYPYFSSYSDSWLKHSENLLQQDDHAAWPYREESRYRGGQQRWLFAAVFREAQNSRVWASSQRRMLQRSRSKMACPRWCVFSANMQPTDLAGEGRTADLVLGNNVLAQVPDLNDFVEGLKILLKPLGILTLEFPHLLQLIRRNEFDTIYHEHFSYFSMIAAKRILEAHGLKVFDVEELPTHGGSLRLYACRTENQAQRIEASVERLIEMEKDCRTRFACRLCWFRETGSRNEVRSRRISSRGRATRQDSCGIRSAWKKCNPPTLLWYWQGFDRVHG